MTNPRPPIAPKRRPRAARAARPLAVLLCAVLTGCAAPGSPASGGGTARCSVQAHQPHESHGSPGNITAKADIRCRPRVDSVTIYVKIQERIGDGWVDSTRAKPNDANRPKSGQKVTVTVSLPCRDGTFRAAARGYGYLNGARSQSTTWTYTRPVKDPCN